jgi:hypothetical protein
MQVASTVLLDVCFMLGSPFNPEDGGDMVLGNVT